MTFLRNAYYQPLLRIVPKLLSYSDGSRLLHSLLTTLDTFGKLRHQTSISTCEQLLTNIDPCIWVRLEQVIQGNTAGAGVQASWCPGHSLS